MDMNRGFHHDVRLLSYVLQTPGARPPIIVGGPGEAKTDMVQALVEALELGHLETVIAALKDPTDFGGVLWPEREADGRPVLHLLSMPWIRRMAEAGRGLVFLDEVNSAPPAVQAVLQNALLTGQIGDTHLSKDKVKWAAAINPTDVATGGWDLSDPVANRFNWLRWAGPGAHDWSTWLLTGNGATHDLRILDTDRWQLEYEKAKVWVAAYMERNPGALRERREAYRDRFPKAYATPRSWADFVRLQATAAAFGDDDAAVDLGCAAIGEPATVEALSWKRANDLGDPEAFMADPASWTPDPKRPDQTYAILLAVAVAATNPSKAKSDAAYRLRWEMAWAVMERAKATKDLVVAAAMHLVQRPPRADVKTKSILSPKVKEFVEELAPVLKLSGLLQESK